MMNKHDELINRLLNKHERCIGPKCENNILMAEAADLLQLYGDALERLGDKELIAVTPVKTNWLEIYQSEFDTRTQYARKTIEE